MRADINIRAGFENRAHRTLDIYWREVTFQQPENAIGGNNSAHARNSVIEQITRELSQLVRSTVWQGPEPGHDLLRQAQQARKAGASNRNTRTAEKQDFAFVTGDEKVVGNVRTIGEETHGR